VSHISVLNRIPMSRRCYQKTFLLCGRRFVRNSKSFGKGNRSEYALKGEDCLFFVGWNSCLLCMRNLINLIGFDTLMPLVKCREGVFGL